MPNAVVPSSPLMLELAEIVPTTTFPVRVPTRSVFPQLALTLVMPVMPVMPVRASAGSEPPNKGPREGEGDDVELEDAPVSAVPRRYKVVFHNDDYTTQEFVIYVLERFFHKTETEARHIMLTVHHKGAAVAGVYTKDVAETKAQQVMDAARENAMPLLLTTEPE